MPNKTHNQYRLNLVIDWSSYDKNYGKADTMKHNFKQWMSDCGFNENKPNVFLGEYEEKMFWIVNTLMKRSPKLKPYIKQFTYHIENEMGIDEGDILANYDKV